MRIRNYKIDAATPNSNVKKSILSAITNVKWINTEIKILAENGTIVLVTTISSLDVKKLFKFFELSSIDGKITRLYD
jgi:hypothetical protein